MSGVGAPKEEGLLCGRRQSICPEYMISGVPTQVQSQNPVFPHCFSHRLTSSPTVSHSANQGYAISANATYHAEDG